MENDYLVFVLGYDLMHDDFQNSDTNECDTVFAIAKKMVADYYASGADNDASCSQYDAFTKWVEENKHNYF